MRTNYNSIPTKGLIGSWDLDGNGIEKSLNNNTLTSVNTTWSKSERGYTKEKAYYSGSAYGYFNDVGTLSAGTMVCAVKFTNVLGNGPLSIGRYNLSAGNQIMRINLRNTATFQVGVPNSQISADLGSNINDGQWHLVIGTWDSTTDGLARLYIDNELVATSPTAKLDNYIPGGVNYGHIGGYAVDYDTTAPTWKFTGDVGLCKIYNRSISKSERHNLYLEANRLLGNTDKNPALLQGTVGYWDFRGGDTSNIITGEIATVTGATLVSDHLGNSNSAYSFNGVNNIISNLSTEIQLGTGDFSISFIASSNLSGATQYLVSNLTTSSVTGIAIGIASDNTFIMETWEAGSPTILNGVGIHSSFTDKLITLQRGVNGVNSIYVDGILDIQTTGNTVRNVTSSQVFDFGRYTFNNTAFLNGKIDSVIVQNRILSASEVKTLYDLTSQKYIYPFGKSSTLGLQEGLVMHLDGSGNDLSGNGNSLTGTIGSPAKIRINQSEGIQHTGASAKNGSSTFSIGDSFTISLDVYVDSLGTYERLINKWDGGDNNTGRGWYLQINNTGTISIALNSNGATYSLTSIQTIIPGKNQKITATFDSTIGFSIYIDGINSIGTVIGTLASVGTNANIVELGRLLFGGVYYYSSLGNKVINTKIRNRVLSPSEIQSEYYLNYIN